MTGVYRGGESTLNGFEVNYTDANSNELITGVWTWGDTNDLAALTYAPFDYIVLSDANGITSGAGVGLEFQYNAYYDVDGAWQIPNAAEASSWMGMYPTYTQVAYGHTDGKSTWTTWDNDEINFLVADAYRGKFGQGLIVSTATGSVFDIADKGPGSINCQSLYINGVAVTAGGGASSPYYEDWTTDSLIPSATEPKTITHGLGTDNVAVSVLVAGASETAFHISWTDANGLSGFMHNDASYAVAAAASTASTGTVNLLIKNRSITQTQTFTIRVIVTPLD